MQVHIWCPRPSDSAMDIRDMFLDRGFRAFKTKSNIQDSQRLLNLFLERVNKGDMWINWGAPPSGIQGKDLPFVNKDVLVLNDATFLNKKSQLIKLRENKVSTLEVSDRPAEGFIGRSLNHQGGRDLVNNSGRDYYTKKVDFAKEVRIHICNGRSIRAGLKVPAVDQKAHPWIRSYDSGWRINYSYAKHISNSHRDLAKAAIKALGLDFGAVDIGVTKADKGVVLEVNTAPGVEGGTLVAYVNQFLKLDGDSVT